MIKQNIGFAKFAYISIQILQKQTFHHILINISKD